MNNGSFDLDNVVIEGHHVRLEPYTDALREPVRAALDCDPEGWQLFAISGQGAHFDGWWDMLNAQVSQGEWIAYAIRQRATDTIVGTTSFLNIKRMRQCVEIGASFLHPDVRSTLVNAEAKYLMLQHAFASGARRVERGRPVQRRSPSGESAASFMLCRCSHFWSSAWVVRISGRWKRLPMEARTAEGS